MEIVFDVFKAWDGQLFYIERAGVATRWSACGLRMPYIIRVRLKEKLSCS